MVPKTNGAKMFRAAYCVYVLGSGLFKVRLQFAGSRLAVLMTLRRRHSCSSRSGAVLVLGAWMRGSDHAELGCVLGHRAWCRGVRMSASAPGVRLRKSDGTAAV